MAGVELTPHPFTHEPGPGSLPSDPLRDRLRPWWLSRELGVLGTFLFIADHRVTTNSIILSYFSALIASVIINIIFVFGDIFVNTNQYHLYA